MGKLSARYQALLPQLKDPRQSALLINEIDLRLHTGPSAAVAPEFQLVSDLQQMRELSEWEAKERKPLQADELASQQAALIIAGENQASSSTTSWISLSWILPSSSADCSAVARMNPSTLRPPKGTKTRQPAPT